MSLLMKNSKAEDEKMYTQRSNRDFLWKEERGISRYWKIDTRERMARGWREEESARSSHFRARIRARSLAPTGCLRKEKRKRTMEKRHRAVPRCRRSEPRGRDTMTERTATVSPHFQIRRVRRIYAPSLTTIPLRKEIVFPDDRAAPAHHSATRVYSHIRATMRVFHEEGEPRIIAWNTRTNPLHTSRVIPPVMRSRAGWRKSANHSISVCIKLLTCFIESSMRHRNFINFIKKNVQKKKSLRLSTWHCWNEFQL